MSQFPQLCERQAVWLWEIRQRPGARNQLIEDCESRCALKKNRCLVEPAAAGFFIVFCSALFHIESDRLKKAKEG
jgi:hypothetical protein